MEALEEKTKFVPNKCKRAIIVHAHDAHMLINEYLEENDMEIKDLNGFKNTICEMVKHGYSFVNVMNKIRSIWGHYEVAYLDSENALFEQLTILRS